MKIKFFAWLKEDLQEDIELDIEENQLNVAELKEKLQEKFGSSFAILKNPSILVSVNLEFANDNTIVKNNDEVSFFPPVTGG